MKYLSLMLVFVMFLATANASADSKKGIKFEKKGFEKAMQKAKKQNKKIFVDCYTQWCGPCKMLAKHTFTDPKVAKYMKENYISVKMDMESPEGKAFNEYFYVTAFPTLLFLDADGNTLERVTGYMNGSKFVEIAKKAYSDPIEKKYAKLDMEAEKKKAEIRKKFKYLSFIQSAGYKAEFKDWETSMKDAKAANKNVFVFFGDAYRPLPAVMKDPKVIEFFNKNFEIVVVDIQSTYKRDANGDTMEDENGKVLWTDWSNKYAPSIYPGCVIVNPNGQRLVEGVQENAYRYAQEVLAGKHKPLVGFWKSVENLGWDLKKDQTIEQAISSAKESQKPLMVIWHRGIKSDINIVFEDASLREYLDNNFEVVAVNYRTDINKAFKQYGSRGANSVSLFNKEGQLVNGDKIPATGEELKNMAKASLAGTKYVPNANKSMKAASMKASSMKAVPMKATSMKAGSVKAAKIMSTTTK